MENLNRWWEAFEQSFSQAMTSAGNYSPVLATALLLMALGWLVARLLRSGVLRSGEAVNRLAGRLGRPMTAARLRVTRRLLALAADFVFWIVILLFAAVASRVAGLETFSTWLDRLVDYLPTLVAGLLIAFVGYLLGTLVRDLVSTALVSAGSRENEIAGFAAQSAVFLTALVIGLDQIGIDVTFLIIIVAVLLGGALLSMAFAFGYGARAFVGNLIAAHQIHGTLEPGDQARIGDVQGRVIEITATAVVMLTEEGRFHVPASRFQNETCAVLSGDGNE